MTAIALALGWSLALVTPTAASAGDDTAAPLIGVAGPAAIDHSYLVVMDQNASSAQERQVRTIAAAGPGEVTADLDLASAPTVVAADDISDAALDSLRHAPGVAYVEADQAVRVSDAGWGLDRIDQRSLPLNGSYRSTAHGAGVTAYVVDTGIRATHRQFGGRVDSGFTAIDDGRGTGDCHGHGTHVAGTVGGSTFGVANQVTLRPVRVLACDGSGSTSGVIAGIDWAVADHQPGQPAVLNMSLGGDASFAIDAAVQGAVSDGIAVVVAAGNDNINACQQSPARAAQAITVGSSTSSDARSSFSNFGSCVDLFAPGSSITSAGTSSDTASRTMSGTSMAAPHVAGAAAVHLGMHPTASPAEVTTALRGQSTRGVLHGVGSGSPNLLLSAVSSPLAGRLASWGAPTITRKPRVRRLMRVDVGAWVGAPVSYQYQWRVNGRPIAGATRATYRVRPALLGKRLSVVVRATRSGWTPAIAKSAPRRVLRSLAPRN